MATHTAAYLQICLRRATVFDDVWACSRPFLKESVNKYLKFAIIGIKENNDSPTAWRLIFILFRIVA